MIQCVELAKAWNSLKRDSDSAILHVAIHTYWRLNHSLYWNCVSLYLFIEFLLNFTYLLLEQSSYVMFLKRSFVMRWFCFGQVLSVTRNLAGLVRQNFQGIPITPQRQCDEHAITGLRTGNKSSGQVYNFTVVLLDPGDDSIPRGNFRQDLLNSGRIVKISLGRGTQEAGTLRTLNGAFPFLRGATTK